MLDTEPGADNSADLNAPTGAPPATAARSTRTRKRSAATSAEPAEPSQPVTSDPAAATDDPAPAKKAPARKRTTKKAAAAPEAAAPQSAHAASDAPAATTKKAPSKRATKKTSAATGTDLFVAPSTEQVAAAPRQRTRRTGVAAPLFQAPEVAAVPDQAPSEEPQPVADPPATPRTRSRSRSRTAPETSSDSTPPTDAATESRPTDQDMVGEASTDRAKAEGASPESADADGEASSSRRRRRRGGRGRRRKPGGDESPATDSAADATADDTASPGDDNAAGDTAAGDNGSDAKDADSQHDDAQGAPSSAAAATGETDSADDGAPDETSKTSTSSRRRRSRRRAGESTDAPAPDDPPQTVVRVREARPSTDDDVTSLKGSTRLEAKKQRRRDGRDQGRRRTPLVTEAEFLARRESVERVMVVRQTGSRTQIAVLEDGVVVEHYVAQASQTSSVGNVYLGKVQNVLPAMEAAFVDIDRGRNAVLYAGEVAWARMGADGGGKARRMESVLSSGQSILVQVTKDPVGHKGARLTGLVSLPGRFLVYAPGGSMSGISRKLPEKERARLKAIVKKVFPDEASVIIRTAAEGASEEELTQDIRRLEAQWLDIEEKAKTATAPAPLYAEPDLAIKVVRDMFNEDFASLVVSGDAAWQTLQPYVAQVAPDLVDRVSHWTSENDVFAEYRVDEQIAKALDRKVWLPSGGSLVIDRTEAMTVIDVNTGKFTGSGGNLEATVTKNNLEAAEEIVRQIRLRDIGGIIVIDFIDMVLEDNRDLVLRRLVECLGRDRTRHQVAEVTSLGLVQMTRKRVGQGLLDVFSEPCEHCNGRGLKIHYEPVESTGGEQHQQTPQPERASRSSQAGRSGRSRRAPAAAAPEGPPRLGPADVIRAVAMAASSKRGLEVEVTESEELGTAAEAAGLATDAVEVFDLAEDEADSSVAAVEGPTPPAEVPTAASPESSDAQPTHDPSVAAVEGPTPPAELPTAASLESLDAQPARARRTRSTRRPAGPPRPLSDAPVAILDAAPVRADAALPEGSSDDGAPRSGDDARVDGRAGDSGTPEPDGAAGASAMSTPASGAAPTGATGPQGPATSAAPAPRRRRATRPAGAPAT